MIVAILNDKVLSEGDKVETFRGELVTFKWANQQGRNRVFCIDAEGRQCEWFPSVINARLEER